MSDAYLRELATQLVGDDFIEDRDKLLNAADLIERLTRERDAARAAALEEAANAVAAASRAYGDADEEHCDGPPAFCAVLEGLDMAHAAIRALAP
jgi:hypothetical protein